MCRAGGRRCDARWDLTHQARYNARRRVVRNREKAELARTGAGGESTDKSQFYDDLSSTAAVEAAALDAKIAQHEATSASGSSAPWDSRGDWDGVTPRKVFDAPLADFAPNEAVRERITSQEFQDLLQAQRDSKAAYEAMDPASTSPRDQVALFDAHKDARDAVERYKDGTAALLDSPEPPERDFDLPEGVQRLGEAESGSAEWLRMRQKTLGGSDVGSITKVGQYGALNYARCREGKMDRDPQSQEHQGAALRGDLWEPALVSAVGQVGGDTVYANKATYTDGARHVNLDGFTLQEGTSKIDRVVEAKTSSHPEEWEGRAPEGYVLQTEHYADFTETDKPSLIVANLNDERLVIYEVPKDAKVPAGPQSNKGFGEEFSYSDVKDYSTGMVQKWGADAQGTPAPRPRRVIADTQKARDEWSRALDKGIVWTDLETTAMTPTKGHIIEVAMVRENPDGSTEKFHRFYGVPKEHESWNGTGAEHIHHISPEDVRGRPVLLDSPDEARQMQEFIGDSTVVAHNAAFERQWLSFNGVESEYADTRDAFGVAVKDEGIADNSMRSLVTWSGDEYVDAHRAINDVDMMRKAARPLMGKIDTWLGR